MVASFVLPATVDVKLIKNLAWEAAVCSAYVYLRKPVLVVVEDLYDEAFLTKFTVKAYVLDVRYERRFASDIISRVKSALIERSIITEELNTRIHRQKEKLPSTIHT